VPAALRRLSPLLRARDLLRRPGTLRRRRLVHRVAGRHTPRSPRHRLHRRPRRPRTRTPELTGPPTYSKSATEAYRGRVGPAIRAENLQGDRA
jgi:hypothetical protein